MYLELRNITFSYDKKNVLENIGFGLNKGEITGLIGANGAGKTTTLKIMIKKLKPQCGRITLNNMDLSKLKNVDFPITYVPDVPVYYEELTVLEHLQFVKSLYPKSNVTVEDIVNQFDLQEHLYKIPGSLSKGNLQKLMIAMALLRSYDVFVADEPFTALDPVQIHRFKIILQKLKEMNKAILISTHLLDMAENLCDKYIFIHNGKVLADGTKEDVINEFHLDPNLSLEQVYLSLTAKGEQYVCI